MTQFSASHYSKTLQDSCPHLELPYLPLSPIALNIICTLSLQIHISYCLLECLKGSSNLTSKQTLSLPTQMCFLLTFILLSEEYHYLSIQLLTSKTYQAALFLSLIPYMQSIRASHLGSEMKTKFSRINSEA